MNLTRWVIELQRGYGGITRLQHYSLWAPVRPITPVARTKFPAIPAPDLSLPGGLFASFSVHQHPYTYAGIRGNRLKAGYNFAYS